MMTKREERMDRWKRRKLEYRNGGGKNWKAAKKALKRIRIATRKFSNALIDNATLAV